MKKLALLVLMVVALAACNRDREMVTGEYGSGVISGQVVMASGGSPAGLEVSVGGTGMSMVVSEDGRFSFVNVPGAPVLYFRRAADAIDTQLSLGSKVGSLTVEVGSIGAKLRSSRPSSKQIQTEGTVVSASAEELVVFSSRGQEQAFVLSATTIIRHGGRMLLAADLTPGTRVHVKSTLAADVYTAVEVIVQNAAGEEEEGEEQEGVRAVRQYEGTIRSVRAGELVVLDSHRQEVTIALNDATVIRKGGTAMTAADLQQGWRVHVKAVTDGDTRTAVLVIVQNTNGNGGGSEGGAGEGEGGQTMTANGAVLAVGEGQLTVQSQPHGEVTVLVDASTIIRKQGQQIAVTDIRPGDEVNCLGKRVDDTTLQARQIEVRGNSGRK